MIAGVALPAVCRPEVRVVFHVVGRGRVASRIAGRIAGRIALMLGAMCLSGMAVMQSASADDDATTIVDDRSERVVFEAVPERIVSLLPSLTETICALGACDQLVGTDRHSNWPASVRQLPKLGGFEDVQLERLYTLEPDVVFAAKSSRILDRLTSLGVTVVALEPQSLVDVRRTVQRLSKVLDRSDEAERLLNEIDSRMEAARLRVPEARRGERVYFEISTTPHAAGPSSFIGELLRTLGMGNVVSEELGPFPELNPEFVVRSNPDIIMASARSLKGMADRPGWDTLDALRQGQTCGFDEADMDVLVRPGPRLGHAAELLADCVSLTLSRGHGVSATDPPR